MPDFERLTRSLELQLAPDEQKPITAARHAGESRARLQLVALMIVVVVVGVLVYWAVL